MLWGDVAAATTDGREQAVILCGIVERRLAPLCAWYLSSVYVYRAREKVLLTLKVWRLLCAGGEAGVAARLIY